MKNKKTGQEQAVEKFIGYIGENLKLIEAIKLHLEDHTGICPDDTNWGDVGNMVHTNELLTQITEFLQIKVQD